ncbi:MAG: hypothetical protein COB29_00850 [Sulfitobacter sp.]|nr:MAG: hypothetical protein COB29_00850 [Sulfitobacter sp.]
MPINETIVKCRICDSKSLVDILDLGNQPPANSLRKSSEEILPLVPLKLVFCKECSTVQLSDTVDPEFLFSHYVWVSGTSATANEYSKVFCSRVLDKLAPSSEEKPFIVEIASNDGTFLKQFQSRGCQVLGVDPAKNIAAIAESSGVKTKVNFFNESVADEIADEFGTVSAVIARNVIPHVKEIHSIISGMSNLLENNGTGIIEFHYVRNILEELHYDSVYHEHLFYFSLKTIGGLLEQYGLHLFDVEESPISGGSLVIYFSKDAKPKSENLQEKEAQEKELKLNDLETWHEFATACKKHASELVSIIEDAKKQGNVIGYGASARSSTMLNFCDLSVKDLDLVIDKNPLKQGLLTPGSDIPIVALDGTLAQFDNVQAIVLLAWNFGKEIESELRQIGYTGAIIMPLPNSPGIL